MDLYAIKTTQGYIVPIDEEGHEDLKKIPPGLPVKITIVRKRDIVYHRRAFKLFRVGFDYWVETRKKVFYRGQEVSAEFKRFRNDITIMAGYFHYEANVRGDVRAVADSLSFGKMSQEEFEGVYSAVIDVLLSKVFYNTRSKQDIDNQVDKLMQFT